MRLAPLWAIPVLAPFSAFAGDSGTGFNMAASLFQSFGSLALVLGLIYLLTHFSRRWLKGGTGLAGGRGYIRIVETRHLAPKKTLHLVEIAGEYMLLGNGGEGITFLKQIDMLEDIEVIEVLGQDRSTKELFQNKLESLMDRIRNSSPMTLDQRS
jgi:flagellar protein FliO/FliZ